MRAPLVAFVFIGCVLSGATSSAASSGGTLSGSVVDDGGKPIAGASVVYRSVPIMTRTANGQRAVTGTRIGSGMKTAADGTFAVGGLPPATYLLCAYGTKSNHLGSCEWGHGTAGIDLADGQTARLKFTVAEGAILTFQVEDPKRQVVDLESLLIVNGRIPLSRANFSVGVWAGSRYARAKLVSVNGATRRYQLVVPKTATVLLYLDTSLRVADATGSGMALRQQSVSISASARSEIVINLAIP